MKIRTLAAAGLMAATGAVAPATQTSAQAETDLPAVIICDVGGRMVLGYLANIEADGSARYMGLSEGVAVVSKDGTVQPSDTMNTGDCKDRTIKELREAGKTREFAN
ncbi:MAG: hypothetical protein AAGF74_11880 [Pseudomonadota bacterium]